MIQKTLKKSLSERIKDIQTEIDALIDARVADLSKEIPVVPAGVHRQLLTARAVGCQCLQHNIIFEKDAA